MSKEFMVVRTPEQKVKGKEVLTSWPKAMIMVPQSCSDLKDYKVREVVKTSAKGKEKRCPYSGSAKLYGHGVCKPREVLHTWSNGRRVYLELHRYRWKCRDCKRTFTEGRELVRSRSRQAEVEALW